MVRAIFKRSKNSKRGNSCISGDKGIILPYIGKQPISGRRETSYPQQPGSYHSGGGRKKGEKGQNSKLDFEMHNKHVRVGIERVKSQHGLLYTMAYIAKEDDFLAEPQVFVGSSQILTLDFYLSARNPSIVQLVLSLHCTYSLTREKVRKWNFLSTWEFLNVIKVGLVSKGAVCLSWEPV